ncbi:hypothetical protein ABVK25_005199 [Lepraria finkii]|uniref:MARVEL domain-containing protein n=1 Tax=Lepraria finkii TaxID=1340010 RepID=A0ABR4BC87_9LECA
MPAIINFVLRGLQIFFAVVILGLSGHLVASQSLGGAPSVTNYEVFLGIWLLVISFLGLAATKVDALAGIVGVALEGLSLLFAFAGGTAMAAKLGVHSCSCSLDHQSCPYLVNNVVINGGRDKNGFDPNVNRVMRCREAQADTAFIWFAFGTFLATFALALLSSRRGGKI